MCTGAEIAAALAAAAEGSAAAGVGAETAAAGVGGLGAAGAGAGLGASGAAELASLGAAAPGISAFIGGPGAAGAGAGLGASGAAEMASLGAAAPGLEGLLAGNVTQLGPAAAPSGLSGLFSGTAPIKTSGWTSFEGAQSLPELTAGNGPFTGLLGKLGTGMDRLGKAQSALSLANTMMQPAPRPSGGGAARPPMGQGEPMPNVAQAMGGMRPQTRQPNVPPTLTPQMIAALRARGIDPFQYMMQLQRGG